MSSKGGMSKKRGDGGGAGGKSDPRKSPTFKAPKPIKKSLYKVPMQSPKKRLTY